ncbi:MAG: hypothetical protein CMO58_06840, partial [Verrucomicrobiales bacterium]|nr:hypothetical protein [Verrucomicrobiales bacterium]
NGIGRFLALGKALARVDFHFFLFRLGKRLARRNKNSWFSGVFGLKKIFFKFTKKGLHPRFFLVLFAALFTKKRDQVRTNLATRR